MDIELSRLKYALTAQLNRNEIVANNLANAKTTGFKKDMTFNDLFEAENSRNIQTNQQADHSQGALEQTGNPLDFAISGPGMFVLESETGELYSRDGHFSLDRDGFLVNSSGYRVLGQGGAVYLSPDGVQSGAVSVSEDGQIYVDDQPMGAFRIARVLDPATLLRVDSNTYRAGEETRLEYMEKPRVFQGQLEDSNVDPVAEMISMIDLQRQFESIQKTVTTLDDALQNAANKIGNY